MMFDEETSILSCIISTYCRYRDDSLVMRITAIMHTWYEHVFIGTYRLNTKRLRYSRYCRSRFWFIITASIVTFVCCIFIYTTYIMPSSIMCNVIASATSQNIIWNISGNTWKGLVVFPSLLPNNYEKQTEYLELGPTRRINVNCM